MGLGHEFMGISPEEYAKAVALAKEVLGVSRNTLLMHLRFLDGALNRLQIAIHPEMIDIWHFPLL